MADYALVNSTTGLIENVTVWDGVSEWSPPEGLTAEKMPEEEVVTIGSYFKDGSFFPAAVYYSTSPDKLGERIVMSPFEPQPPDTTTEPVPAPPKNNASTN